MSTSRSWEIVLGVALLLSVVSIPFPLYRHGLTLTPPQAPNVLRIQSDRLDALHRQTLSQQEDLRRLTQETEHLAQVVREQQNDLLAVRQTLQNNPNIRPALPNRRPRQPSPSVAGNPPLPDPPRTLRGNPPPPGMMGSNPPPTENQYQ